MSIQRKFAKRQSCTDPARIPPAGQPRDPGLGRGGLSGVWGSITRPGSWSGGVSVPVAAEGSDALHRAHGGGWMIPGALCAGDGAERGHPRCPAAVTPWVAWGGSPGPLPGGKSGRIGRWGCPMPQDFGGAGEAAAPWRDVLRGFGSRSTVGSRGFGGGAQLRPCSHPGPGRGWHRCARLGAGDRAGTQPPLAEAFGIFSHRRCRSIGSEARERVPRILINLFSDIFSSLDWIFFFFFLCTHCPPRKKVLVSHPGPRRDRPESAVCAGGGSGAVYLSQQAEFRPGSAGLQRDLSQRRVLPSWRRYLIFALHGFAGPMPPWDSLCAVGSVQLGGVLVFVGQIQPGAATMGCPEAGVTVGGSCHADGSWGSGGAHHGRSIAAHGGAVGCWSPSVSAAGARPGGRGGAQPAPPGWQLARVPWRRPGV